MLKTLVQLQENDALPPSDWQVIRQQDIDLFAQATGDHQWIHVDALRCQRESPFGCTIAHGYLSLTLMPQAFYRMVAADPRNQTLLNYGVDKIRFLEPVRVNDKIRFQSKIYKIEQKPVGRLFYFDTLAEIAGRDKPAMRGMFLMLLLGANT